MNIRQRLSFVVVATLLVISVTGICHAQQTAPTVAKSESIEAVWGREELYWRLVKAGDVEKYRQLWDDNFRGWPCKNQHTADKTEIGNWVRDIRDQKVKLTYSLTQEGAAAFGDIVVIYYRTPMIYEYADGRVEGKDRSYKFTHTWRKTGNSWLIIGGMCGEIQPSQ